MRQIYICTDTMTGIFSAIYDAWKLRDYADGCGIALEGRWERELFCEYHRTEETEEKARAVERLIRRHLGNDAYQDLCLAALSACDAKGDAILQTMLAARNLSDSRRIMEHLSHPAVEKVFELSRSVSQEAHHYKGFVRFSELESGILFSAISPKHQVLTCIAPHFTDRLPLEHWMIHDKTHQMFAIHEAKKQWALVWGDGIDLSAAGRLSERELEYERLWKCFFRTVAIRERMNPRCQRNNLPLRFRGDMTEMQHS